MLRLFRKSFGEVKLEFTNGDYIKGGPNDKVTEADV